MPFQHLLKRRYSGNDHSDKNQSHVESKKFFDASLFVILSSELSI
jgi:hypothetical protein